MVLATSPPAAFFPHKADLIFTGTQQHATRTTSRGLVALVTPNGGRGRGGRHPPHCQLCRTNGHYASSCPSLHTYASNAATSDANLAQAFTSQCHVTQGHPDWYVDSGAMAHMTSSPDKCQQIMPLIQDRETKQVIAQGLCEDGLYVLRDTPMALAATVGVSRKASFELWHNRLGHVSFDVISTLNKLGVLDVTSILPKPNICKPCQLSKSQRLPFELNSKRSSYPLDLIHCDLWGPAPVSSDGYLYYVIFVDDYSRFTWFYPLKTKSGFYTVLSAFIKLVQTQLSRKIKVFQSDGGTEFVNHTVRKIFEDNGTLHRLSCPYTPQQNGRAERKHRHLVETGLAMLFHAHVPASYWVDAFSSATYIINRLPTKLLGNHSPFELLYSRLPNYTNFRAFGCLVYPYLRDYSAHKLAPRSIPCVFIGYNPQYKGYKCLDPDSSRIYITRHARFDEVTFPFASTANPNALSTLQLCTFLEDGPPISDAPVPESRPTDTRPSSSSPCGLCPVPTTAAEPIHEPDSTPSSPYSSEDDNPPTDSDDVSSHGAPPAPPATAPTEPSSVHQMKTRSKSGIFKTKHSPDFVSLTSHALHAALFSLVQPKGFKSAAKHPQWMAAMHDEMEALKQNCTWTLVPRPSASNIVGSKWVYRIKYHADGSVERFKARVVAQGFTQIPGLDYSHTFSPVVKASTVRIVLSLAVLHRWRLHQLDVKNAFLHGHLNETVYMEQPPGFIDPQFPNHVCKLSKALYGLKQAPRAWFHRLSSFLLAHGFVCSRADTSLFVFTKDSCIMYLLVYVDDLILTGNNESLLTSFTTRLNQEFAIKDLGDLSYFLGLEVSYTNDGLFLSQAKYATDVLTRAALLDSKPVSTPLAANEVFVTGGSLFANPTLYRSLVGALQYLTITRPDLSYAVNQASQFLHAPTDAHFQSVKRILRYVKGTITYGLIFRRPHSNSILGYSDADWARCIETRRSTYGYSIFLGGNLVSWSAKKQPTVSRSSCESEYRAMANTAAEIIWITHLLRELHALPPDRPTLLCDNKSALFMSQNPVSHKRAKHIDLDYHFVRELVASGDMGLSSSSYSEENTTSCGIKSFLGYFVEAVIKVLVIYSELTSFLASDCDELFSLLASDFSSNGSMYSREDLEVLRNLPIYKTVIGTYKKLNIQDTCMIALNTFLKPYNEQCPSYGSESIKSQLVRALGVNELQDKHILAQFSLPGFEENPQSEQEDILLYLYMNWHDLQQDSLVIEALKETKFVSSADEQSGDFYKPKDLFDPGDSLLRSVFSGEVQKFPGERFASDGWLNILRKIGLQNTCNADIVLECARRVEFLGTESMKPSGFVDDFEEDFSNTRNEVSLEIRFLAETLINAKFSSFVVFYGSNFCNILGKIACVPAEKGFPSVSGKKGGKRVLCSYSEAILLKDWPLAWSVAPILSMLGQGSLSSVVNANVGDPSLPLGTQSLLPFIEAFLVLCDKLQENCLLLQQDNACATESKIKQSITSSSQSQTTKGTVIFTRFDEKQRRLLNAFDRVIARLQQPVPLEYIPVEAEYQKDFSELLQSAARDYGTLAASVSDIHWTRKFQEPPSVWRSSGNVSPRFQKGENQEGEDETDNDVDDTNGKRFLWHSDMDNGL
ncbi:retrovirus-related pol polyprotein from transposon TNT 1-94 [Tanacetum coccineum]